MIRLVIFKTNTNASKDTIRIKLTSPVKHESKTKSNNSLDNKHSHRNQIFYEALPWGYHQMASMHIKQR